MSYKTIKNSKGMALLEAMPIVWIMFILMGATLGSWGIVHTAILNSIAARNYTFFLFNNRSDLSYLRDFGKCNYSSSTNDTENRYYRKDGDAGHGKRFSYIISDKSEGSTTAATLRRSDFRNVPYDDNQTGDFLDAHGHNTISSKVPSKNANHKAGPAWIMVGYGICLSANCGD